MNTGMPDYMDVYYDPMNPVDERIRPGFGFGFGRPFGFGIPFLTGLAAGALLSPGFGFHFHPYPYFYPYPYPYPYPWWF